MQRTFAGNLCGCECSFEIFFKENYQKLLQTLCPVEEEKYIFDILFNAYSIKFQGLDYEYKNICASLTQDNEECIIKKEEYLKQLSMIAMDEYDSFLDDLSFEICGCENTENRFIRKNKKKYRKQLKKLIAKHCK